VGDERERGKKAQHSYQHVERQTDERYFYLNASVFIYTQAMNEWERKNIRRAKMRENESSLNV
jgi:hypothetical protein